MQFLFIILVFRVENTFYQALTGYRQYDLMVSIQGDGSVTEDKKQSFEDELISAFLTKSTEKARQQIADEGKLSTENAIPLMLKSQYNHIAHLDEQMVTKTEFNALKEQFNGAQRSGGVHEMDDYAWIRLARHAAGLHKFHQVGKNKEARPSVSEVLLAHPPFPDALDLA